MQTATEENRPAKARLSMHVTDEAATERLGRTLADALVEGDCLLLDGPMGAGKSHLARAIIRARLGDPDAEVPSPTYTLLNAYDADGVEILHGDLYRLASADEIEELGLDDAVGRAIILLEWPDRWASPPPRRMSVSIAVAPGGRGRDITFEPHGANWSAVVQTLRAFA